MKVYAVKNGRKNGVFETWEECKEQVLNFPNAQYKSFTNIDEAYQYITNQPITIKEDDTELEDVLPYTAYTDGSCSNKHNLFSFGTIIFDGDLKQHQFSKTVCSPKYSQFANISGELLGVKFAINFAIKNNFPHIHIYYDYSGIEKWATGEWKRKNILTQQYYDYIDSIKDKIEIHWHKVKGHTGVKYNELADKIAGESIKEYKKTNNITD